MSLAIGLTSQWCGIRSSFRVYLIAMTGPVHSGEYDTGNRSARLSTLLNDLGLEGTWNRNGVLAALHTTLNSLYIVASLKRQLGKPTLKKLDAFEHLKTCVV